MHWLLWYLVHHTFVVVANKETVERLSELQTQKQDWCWAKKTEIVALTCPVSAGFQDMLKLQPCMSLSMSPGRVQEKERERDTAQCWVNDTVIDDTVNTVSGKRICVCVCTQHLTCTRMIFVDTLWTLDNQETNQIFRTSIHGLPSTIGKNILIPNSAPVDSKVHATSSTAICLASIRICRECAGSHDGIPRPRHRCKYSGIKEHSHRVGNIQFMKIQKGAPPSNEV